VIALRKVAEGFHFNCGKCGSFARGFSAAFAVCCGSLWNRIFKCERGITLVDSKMMKGMSSLATDFTVSAQGLIRQTGPMSSGVTGNSGAPANNVAKESPPSS